VCGIAGKLSERGTVERRLLERMCEVMEHRGPDSRGLFLDDGIGLGIQRLAVIDLQTGDQPIFNEDRSVVVVLNGEIYNYPELRSALEARGHRFASCGDTEVIVHLYEDHGADCVVHLRGMFAFALWDRHRRRLLLARDRVGKKPLFYGARDGCVWFASEPRSILQDPEIPRDVNLDAIDSYLHYQYVPSPLSAFAALRKLPPAHTLTWQDGEIVTRRYWTLSYARKLVTDKADVQTRIRERLLEATRLRMRSDVPLGALLSGGVDSSAVVAAMVRQAHNPVKTFSIGFDVDEFDETAYARQVAELLETDHHELRVEPDAIQVLPRLVWHYGEPFADSSAIPSFYLAEFARRHVTVALNGDGGDECFAGYTRYWGLDVVRRLGYVPPAVARLAALLLDRIGEGSRMDGRRARARRAAHALTMKPWERYVMWMAYFTEAERRALYTPSFLAALPECSARDVIRAPYLDSDATTLVDRLLDVDIQTYLPGDLLVKMDIATMAHSLEVRSPLLDHEFMELAATVPAALLIEGRVGKKIFKDALRAWLPAEVLDRRKMGFQVPLREWFRGPLRELPGDVLLDTSSVARGWFRPDRVRGLIREHVDGRRDNSHKLWTLIQLELWLRTYIDAPAPRPPVALVA
jgi:asparagine synthase (glutamine-hydrolysing)